MAESKAEKSGETLSPPPASSPDELSKDVDVKVSDDNEKSVVGGKTTGKAGPEVYLTMTMEGAFIT